MKRLLLVALVLLAGCGGSDAKLGLRLDDFPGSGWREYGEDHNDTTCKSLVAAKDSAKTYAASPQFEHQDGLLATSRVYVYADGDAAHRGFVSLTSDETGVCLAKSLGDKAAQPVEIAAVGQEHAAIRATAPATDKHPAGVFDLVFARNGDRVVELIFIGLKKPFEPGLRDQLTAKVVGRQSLRAG